MIALLVTIDIKPEYKDRFMEELMLDAKGANDVEPGCLRFDVLQDNEDSNRVHLYEVYRGRGSDSGAPGSPALREVAGHDEGLAGEALLADALHQRLSLG